jgi:hypothetical protein
MSSPSEFIFKIDAFRPETLPMKRLAEYMLDLARLLGETERVHFRAVKKGSTALVQHVEPEALPKVRQRVRDANGPDSPPELARLREKINDMLASDNAVGLLSEKGSSRVVLKFPGRLSVGTVIGPVVEEGALQGTLVRIGGEDQSAHAHVQDGDQTYICEMPRELAKRLSPYLYGQPVRVYGRGRWRRERRGEWVLIDFKARDFEPLETDSLANLAGRLANVPSAGWDTGDPIGDWRKLRRDA